MPEEEIRNESSGNDNDLDDGTNDDDDDNDVEVLCYYNYANWQQHVIT